MRAERRGGSEGRREERKGDIVGLVQLDSVCNGVLAARDRLFYLLVGSFQCQKKE